MMAPSVAVTGLDIGHARPRRRTVGVDDATMTGSSASDRVTAPATGRAPMTRRPRRLLAAWPALVLVGALLLSACARTTDPIVDGDPTTSSTSSVAPSPSAPSPSAPSPSAPFPSAPSAAPALPPATDPSGPATGSDGEPLAPAEVPLAWVEVDGERTELAPASSCWDGLCVDGLPANLRDDVPRVDVATGTTVTLVFSVLPDEVSVQAHDEDVVTLGEVETADGAATVDWEVTGPAPWRVTITGAKGDASWWVGVRAPTPAATAAAQEFGVTFPGPDWTRPDGTPADTRDQINLIAGAGHCDWERASLLHIPWPLDAEVVDSSDMHRYIWDPDEQLKELGITRDALVGEVSADATDTGFHTAHQQLWLGDDADEFAYLVADTGEVRRLERPVAMPASRLACA